MLSLKVTGRLDELPSISDRACAKGKSSPGCRPPISSCGCSRRRRRCSRRAPGWASTRRRRGRRRRCPRRPRWSARRTPRSTKRAAQRDRVATFVTRGISAKADLEAADAALEIAEGRHQDALEEVRNRQARARAAALRAGASPDSSSTTRCCARRSTAWSASAGVGRRVSARPARRSSPSCASIRCACSWRCPSARAAVSQSASVVRVSIEGESRPSTGPRRRASARAITEGTRTLPVEAEVPNPRRRAAARLVRAAPKSSPPRRRAFVVPQSAVVVVRRRREDADRRRTARPREQRVRTGRRDRRSRRDPRRALPADDWSSSSAAAVWPTAPPVTRRRAECHAHPRRDLHPAPGLRDDARPGAGRGRRRARSSARRRPLPRRRPADA